jgi:hypothetical protein
VPSNVYAVNLTTDDGTGATPFTLSWAIGQVNADGADSNADPDVIQFASGVTTIGIPSGALPEIDRPAILNVDQSLSVGGNFAVANGANVTVSGDLTLTDGGYIYINDTSALHVAGNLALGNDGFLFAGQTSSDAATLTVGGNFTIGNASAGPFDSGFVQNYGASSITVAGDFAIYGDGGSSVYNGFSDTDTAHFNVGGNFSLGAGGYVYNFGSSTLDVGANLSLGNDGYLYNGPFGFDNNAATLSVGGNFTIGDGSSSQFDSGFVYNYSSSEINVGGNFAIHGDGGSFIYNGLSDSDAAAFHVGGSFGLGANSFVYTYGSNDFSVNDFTLGASSFFADFGTMSVTGNFDPGAGNPGNSNLLGGTFNANPGSTVTTNASTWTFAGGILNVEGQFTDDGVIDLASGVNVSGNGSVTVGAAGTLTTGSLVVADNALVDNFGSVTTQTLALNDNGHLKQEAGSHLQVQQPAGQRITFGPLGNATYGDPDFTIAASANSGLPVSFTSTGNATVSQDGGGVWHVHITGGGGATITAYQAGDSNFNAAGDVSQSFSIAKANQNIAFGPLPNKTLGDPDFAIGATATSGLAVTFTATGSATVYQSGATWYVHLTGNGGANIVAHQAGNNSYNAASDVSQSFTVSAPSGQTVILNAQHPTATYIDASGNQVTVQLIGGGAAAATLNLQTVSGNRQQLTSLAVTNASSGNDLSVTDAGGGSTSIGNVTIAGTGFRDINLAASVGKFSMTNVGFRDLTVGNVSTSFQLVGDGRDVSVGSIFAGASLSVNGNERDVTLGAVQSGANVTLAGTERDFTVGDIRGNLTVTAAYHDGAVGRVYTGGHVYLQSIGHQFTTASKKSAAGWVGNDLLLADGGDILLGTTTDKSKVKTA